MDYRYSHKGGNAVICKKEVLMEGAAGRRERIQK